MKILFLDINGVLNSVRSAVALGGHSYRKKYHEKFDKIAVALIRKLCNSTSTKICLSSIWRIGYTVETLPNLANTLDLPIIDKTPKFLDRIRQRSFRGTEIQAWLDRHLEVTKYAIVDDDDSDMLVSQKPFLVHTDNYEGLSYKNYEQLFKILESN